MMLCENVTGVDNFVVAFVPTVLTALNIVTYPLNLNAANLLLLLVTDENTEINRFFLVFFFYRYSAINLQVFVIKI